MSNLTNTPRSAYDGERTKWTREDGIYSIGLIIPFSDLPVGDRECPAVQHAINRVKAALGSRQKGYMSGGAGSGANVVSHFTAESDADAGVVYSVVMSEVGATAGVLAYMQPNLHGASSDRILETKAR